MSTILAAAIAACSPLLSTYAKAESIEESADIAVLDTEASKYVSGILSADDVPECLDFVAIANNEHTARLYDKETALDTVIFTNKDGSETIYMFDENVKYLDENGKVADKSNKLYSNIESRAFSSDYLYVNKDNDINTYFPKSLKTDVGVSVEAQGQVLEMYPISNMVSEVIVDDDLYGVYYDDVFGEFTGIRYKPSFSGYKEDIVLERNVGNMFGFILETGDLQAVLENGVIYIRDENDENFGIISPIYVYDSFTGDPSLDEGRHFTYDNKFELTQISDGKYELIVIVDEEFLNDPTTVYPVIVDPSLYTYSTNDNTGKSILDTPIYNGSGAAGKSAGYNQLAVIGYVDSSYGTGRLLMRFPGLMNQPFMKKNYEIKSALLTMNECSGGSSNAQISVYNYTSSTSWDESTAYSSSVYNGLDSNRLDFWMFSYPNGVTRSFDITSAVKDWQLDNTKGANGIIFKNTSSETEPSMAKTFYTSEGANKPCLIVTYSEFYGCKGVRTSYGTDTNCLAYAFFLNKDTFMTNSVIQGMIAKYTPLSLAISQTEDEIEDWLNNNFPKKNRKLTRYDEPLESDEWLVAMRVGVGEFIVYNGYAYEKHYYDYHFWYRTSDGDWYNKHGIDGKPEKVSGNVINPSLTGSESNGWCLGNTYYYTSRTVYYAIKQ